jgi:hypothetical protein
MQTTRTESRRYTRPVWEKLAVQWGLTLEQMPLAVRYLYATILHQQGRLDLREVQVRPEGTSYVYQDRRPGDASPFLTVTRPEPWGATREQLAMEAMREMLRPAAIAR